MSTEKHSEMLFHYSFERLPAEIADNLGRKLEM